MKRRLFLGLAALAIMASGIAAGVAWTQVAHAQEETTAKGFAARLATILGLEDDVRPGRVQGSQERHSGREIPGENGPPGGEASESPRTKPMQPSNGMKSRPEGINSEPPGYRGLVSMDNVAPVPSLAFDRRRGPGSKSGFDRRREPWFQVWILWTARSRF